MFKTINGVNSIDKDQNISVYPNPSNGIVNVSYNFATPTNISINVYNSTGALVASTNNVFGQSGIHNIDLSNQANGLYHVRMMIDGKQVTRTISLNK